MPTPNTERLWTKWSFLTVQKSCLRVNGILRSLSAIGYATCPPDYSELDGGATPRQEKKYHNGGGFVLPPPRDTCSAAAHGTPR